MWLLVVVQSKMKKKEKENHLDHGGDCPDTYMICRNSSMCALGSDLSFSIHHEMMRRVEEWHRSSTGVTPDCKGYKGYTILPSYPNDYR